MVAAAILLTDVAQGVWDDETFHRQVQGRAPRMDPTIDYTYFAELRRRRYLLLLALLVTDAEPLLLRSSVVRRSSYATTLTLYEVPLLVLLLLLQHSCCSCSYRGSAAIKHEMPPSSFSQRDNRVY